MTPPIHITAARLLAPLEVSDHQAVPISPAMSLAQESGKIPSVTTPAPDAEGAYADSAARFDGGKTGQEPLTADEDLPGTGPDPLTASQRLGKLRALLTQENPPAMNPEAFQAIVAQNPKHLHNITRLLQGRFAGPVSMNVLGAMYQSLLSSMQAPQDSPLERLRNFLALSKSFSSLLRNWGRDRKIRPMIRQRLMKATSEFLDNGLLLEELIKSREISGQIDSFGLRGAGSFPTTREPAASKKSEPWQLAPPIAKETRAQNTRIKVTRISLADIDRRAQQDADLLNRALSRLDIARDPRNNFSPNLIAELEHHVSRISRNIRDHAQFWPRAIRRTINVSMRKTFESQEKEARHKIVAIPTNQNLKLIPVPQGFVISAHFETNIQDDAVLAFIKSSIEDYWQGSFTLKNRTYAMKAKIQITKIKNNGKFSSSLRIRDGQGDPMGSGVLNTLLGESEMTLDRQLHYATPAHEFGHVLGLNDEYQETFDIRKRKAVHAQAPQSLWSAPDGIVLPRHFKTVYFLLRRSCLAQPNKGCAENLHVPFKPSPRQKPGSSKKAAG